MSLLVPISLLQLAPYQYDYIKPYHEQYHHQYHQQYHQQVPVYHSVRPYPPPPTVTQHIQQILPQYQPSYEEPGKYTRPSVRFDDDKNLQSTGYERRVDQPSYEVLVRPNPVEGRIGVERPGRTGYRKQAGDLDFSENQTGGKSRKRRDTSKNEEPAPERRSGEKEDQGEEVEGRWRGSGQYSQQRHQPGHSPTASPWSNHRQGYESGHQQSGFNRNQQSQPFVPSGGHHQTSQFQRPQQPQFNFQPGSGAARPQRPTQGGGQRPPQRAQQQGGNRNQRKDSNTLTQDGFSSVYRGTLGGQERKSRG